VICAESQGSRNGHSEEEQKDQAREAQGEGRRAPGAPSRTTVGEESGAQEGGHEAARQASREEGGAQGCRKEGGAQGRRKEGRAQGRHPCCSAKASRTANGSCQANAGGQAHAGR
jgi:hypothetical protein